MSVRCVGSQTAQVQPRETVFAFNADVGKVRAGFRCWCLSNEPPEAQLQLPQILYPYTSPLLLRPSKAPAHHVHPPKLSPAPTPTSRPPPRGHSTKAVLLKPEWVRGSPGTLVDVPMLSQCMGLRDAPEAAARRPLVSVCLSRDPPLLLLRNHLQDIQTGPWAHLRNL